MKYLGWVVAGLLLVAFIYSGFGKDSTPTENSQNLTWNGAYYKNSEYPTNSIQERLLFEEAPTFSSLADCIKWGSNMVANNPSDAFECSYGCRFEEQYDAVVCEDGTKMIYKGRFQR